jgi:hypothetical protein
VGTFVNMPLPETGNYAPLHLTIFIAGQFCKLHKAFYYFMQSAELWEVGRHQSLGKIPGCRILDWATFNSPYITKLVRIQKKAAIQIVSCRYLQFSEFL